MRRDSLTILRCPRCNQGALNPETPSHQSALIFGPVQCAVCAARYPVHEGLIDLVAERPKRSPLQQAMELPWVARSWERYLRPAVDALLTRSRIDTESEYAVAHSMLGKPQAPVLDLGCGSGLFLRRLARDFPDQALIGLDVSRPMIEEAMAQVHENALAADFVRAEVPPLPFTDHSLGGIVATGLVHFVVDLHVLLAESARVLAPGARFVGSTFDVAAVAKPLMSSAGLHPRSETELRELTRKAGLLKFERVKAGPMVVWRAEAAVRV